MSSSNLMKILGEKFGNKGFSLIELLVVMTIMSILSTILILNFRSVQKNAIARHQASSLIVSDVRRIQSMALAGIDWNGSSVCGFGVHYLSQSSYLLYARGSNILGKCDNGNRNYNVGDLIVETKSIANNNLTLLWSPFAVGPNSKDDIYFELPDPKTYIDNKNIAGKTATIAVALAGMNCPGADCTQIIIYISGKIDIIN